jgi:hypothetical protein
MNIYCHNKRKNSIYTNGMLSTYALTMGFLFHRKLVFLDLFFN